MLLDFKSADNVDCVMLSREKQLIGSNRGEGHSQFLQETFLEWKAIDGLRD